MNKRTLQRVLDKYDGDNDVGNVTWMDQVITEELVEAITHIELLEKREAELVQRIDRLELRLGRLERLMAEADGRAERAI